MPQAARARARGWAFYVLVWIAMMAVHHDFWNWRDASLWLGFLPVGLAYHLGYSVLAAVVMLLLVRFAWPSELETLEREPTAGRGSERA